MPAPYGLIVKEWQEGLTFENLPTLLSSSAPVTLIVSDRVAGPVLRYAEQVEVVPNGRLRPGDLVLARTDSELFLGWALRPVEAPRWQVRQPFQGMESTAAIPLARAVRLLKREGGLSLESGWGAWLTGRSGVAIRFPWVGRGREKLFGLLWKLSHPLWPPIFLGSPAQLSDGVAMAYSERSAVDLYEASGSVLDAGELQAVRRFKPGSHILDIGCGTGREALALAKLGHHVMALDVSHAMLKTAQQQAERERITARFVLATPDAFEAPPRSFDGIYMTQEVYSYIPGRQRRIETLVRLRRLLTEDGVLLLFQSVASRHVFGRSLLVDLLRRIARGMGLRDVSEPGDGWTAEGTYGLAFKHFFYSAREIHSELRAGGFQVENVIGFCRVCRPLAP